MKFKDKYPDMLPIHDERQGIIKAILKNKCHQCDDVTQYVHIGYGSHFCSEECVENMDYQYDGWLNEDPGNLE